jgi:hypothetical protein
MHACIRTRRAYLVQGRSWCLRMKLVDGVDRDGTDLITRLLLRLINTCSCGGEKKLHHQRRRNWRRNEGTKVMAKACWFVSLIFICLSSFLLLVLHLISRLSCLYWKEMVAAAVGSVEAGLRLRWQRGLLQVQGKKWPREGNARMGTGFGCSLSLSFLSEGNGNEWAVGKSEMRKSGKVFGYG